LSWYLDSFWQTPGETVLIASAKFLDIDEVANAELGVTFMREVVEPRLDERELILFDIAPGGAGYCAEIGAHLKDVFSTQRASCGIADAETVAIAAFAPTEISGYTRAWTDTWYHKALMTLLG